MTVQQRATLEDVARLAGVSSKTVSRVFTHRDLVAPDTVDRVLAAAKRLRFRPNTARARACAAGGRRTPSASSWASSSNPFYYKVAAGIERELAASGYSLVVATTDDTAEGEERVADALLVAAHRRAPADPGRRRPVLPRGRAPPRHARHRDRPAGAQPRRRLDRAREPPRASFEATTRLLARGHRRIGYVCNPASVYTQSERLRGYRDAIAAYGIPDTVAVGAPASTISRVPPDGFVGDLLRSDDAPTAVITGNNRVTVGALRVLRDRDDDGRTALIGFDDFDTADVLGVTVITYDPRRRSAARAADARARAHAATRPASRGRSSCRPGSSSAAPASGRPRRGDGMTRGVRPVSRPHGVGVVRRRPRRGLPRVLHWGEPLGRLSDADADGARDAALSRQTRAGHAGCRVAAVALAAGGRRLDADAPACSCAATACCTTRAGRRRRVGADDADAVVVHGAGRGIRSRARDPRSRSRRAESSGWMPRCGTRARRSAPVEVEWLESTLPVPTTTDTLHDVRRTVDAREAAGDDRDAAGLDRAAVAPRPAGPRPPRSMLIASEGEPRWGSGRALGRAPRVVVGLHVPRRPRHRRRDPARRRRAAAPGRDRARAGRGVRARRARRSCTPTTGSTGCRAPRAHVAARAAAASDVPRPLTLNTWEAVYFDHDPARLARARRARGRGRHRALRARRRMVPGPPRRHHEPRRLGRRPVGLARRTRAARRARARARACSSGCGSSPRWSASTPTSRARIRSGCCTTRAHVEATIRRCRGAAQYVLDLANPDAYAHVLGQIDALVDRARHRLHQVGPQPRPRRERARRAPRRCTRR